MADALVFEGVTKRFGDVVAVRDLNLAIPEGSIYGFLGPNGAGKTTSIRMAVGILRPDEGRLSVLGQPSPERVRHRLGYLPEEKGLYKKMKVADLLAYYGQLKGMHRHDAHDQAKNLLARFGLGDWQDKRCEALSKGMGQKLQLLATLIHEPDLVILDEPFSGLDPVNVEVMREAILDMRRAGRTVVFSTHVMSQAEQICDSIFLIHRGNTVIDGSLADVKSRGQRGIQLDYEGDGSVLRDLPGVTRLNDHGMSAEIFLEDGADPQALLESLVGRLTVRRFDLTEPSLHEIFVRAVGEDPDPEDDDA